MSTASLIIGRSALQASQIALQVTGNNIANATTPGYSRQRAELFAPASQRIQEGVYIGRGVGVEQIRRMLNPQLQQRRRDAQSDEAAASVIASIADSIESVTNELSGNDVSTRLTEMFNAFSDLANNAGASVTRAAVVETAERLSAHVRNVRRDLMDVRDGVDREIDATVKEVNGLLQQVVALNKEIVQTEIGAGENPTLRDQRDQVLNELAQFMDISTVTQDNGAINVFVGSEPVIDGEQVRFMEFRLEPDPATGDTIAEIVLKDDDTKLFFSSGSLDGLMDSRRGMVQDNIDTLDAFAANVIFEVNKLHTQGRPEGRLTNVLSEIHVPVADQTLAINDPTNATFSALPFSIKHGSFPLVLTDSNGNQVSTTIQIDLDGIDNTGAPGFADDTSIADLVAAIDAFSPNIQASINAGGQVVITTSAGYDVSFAEVEETSGGSSRVIGDSSGVLAALGIGTLFKGRSALDMSVRDELKASPTMLSLGLGEGSNETALAMASLRDAELAVAGNVTLSEQWQQRVERNAVATSGAAAELQAVRTIRQSLQAQEQGISGVSLDEESINLITYQQQYSGAARFISVVDELTQVLISLV
ncbi:MAG: flagellar hook-associated protein FlgK [Planctomycetota bacterium]